LSAGASPIPHQGAYSARPDPLAVFVGLLLKGCESRRGERQRRERKGRGEERERRGERM